MREVGEIPCQPPNRGDPRRQRVTCDARMRAGGTRTVRRRRLPGLALAPLAAASLAAAILVIPPQAFGVKAPKEFLGVAAPRAKADEFARMARGGVGTYRVLIHWAQAQHSSSGPYDWKRVDEEIRNAAANGIQPLVVFYGSARFAARNPRRPPLDSNDERRGWKRFVRAAVERYGPEGAFWEANPDVSYKPVRVWQAWNEQNADHFWRSGPSPKRYAKLVRLTDTAVEDIDPEAEVVLGGMFGNPTGSRSVKMKVFLRKLYRAGFVRERFDGVALHPYGRSIGEVMRQVGAARAIMNRNGDGAKGIWVTEIGWATDGPRGWDLVTSRKGQARKLTQAFQRLIGARGRYGLRGVIWFSWRDFKDTECRWCGKSGLFSRSGKPKPAWFQFTRFTGGVP